ncbi:MAG: hypothetical protein UX02_C0005G0010 [Candidatus Moranbacteria bacterium GW2011_GWC1_45_18]|nr:MAG: hypothetical protein UT79_C0005G0010 [Candidatus Moranbacteria bacterium GW2011_GWC2_40_12]KKT33039.1 MAG: hypothetical protein UW19_C0012G0011 [Candidatus Moranbacteria bacterium GW2011_GWF2_44_10]KKT99197.1 MAG: hypothetical protein UX02_C0005G0010 [Candidatus Moranbacteria bacterium GW2011_GWC1_45_18]OGI23783.1 MAG: hypothetical protein A2194_04215 [Candidatus Moranbacteria bacterium RIFOXYA1_FULL_44_8]OGI36409.1 MAG: hypothetical protein A2407_03765 [Candidatus Moranbacteria bacteri
MAGAIVINIEGSDSVLLAHLSDRRVLKVNWFFSFGKDDLNGLEIPTGEEEINRWVREMIKESSLELIVDCGDYEKEFDLKISE